MSWWRRSTRPTRAFGSAHRCVPGGEARARRTLPRESGRRRAARLIAARRPENRYGWLWSAFALGLGVLLLAEGYAIYALLVAPEPLPGGALAAWTVVWLTSLNFGLLPFFFLLFPSGRLPSHRWRFLAWLALADAAAATGVQALKPGPLWSFPAARGPIQVDGGAARALTELDSLTWLIFVAAVLASVASLYARFRRARGEERQQLKWLSYAAAVLILFLSVDLFYQEALDALLGTADRVLFAVLQAGLYAAIGVAVLKYRLYDIDLIIKRTLVYGALTGALGLIYWTGVSATQWLLRGLTGQGSEFAVVASTLAVAALFRPLQRRIRDGIDHRFYRRRYDAVRTAQGYGAALRNDADLDALSDALERVVRDTMQPESVCLWLRPAERDSLS